MRPRRRSATRAASAGFAACVLAASSAGAQNAPAQGAPPQGALAGATIRGVVFDSLARRPLAGAAVFVEGTTSMATADSAGRFVIAGVAVGRQLVTAEHPALAGVGLSALTAAVDARDGEPAAVVLATPGRSAVWHRVCAADPPRDPNAPAGIVYGEVRDVATDARLAGALAYVSWTAVVLDRGRLQSEPRTLAVHTDSLGVYRACGVPADAEVEVRAAAGAYASGRASVPFDARALARVDLLVARETAAARTSVTGTVRDTTGTPRAGVRLEVDDVEGATAVTDDAGRFTLAGVPAGTRTVVLRALGFTPQTATVAVRADAAPVDLVLRPVTQLARVTVRADRTRQAALFAAIDARRRNSESELADSTVIRRTGQLRTALTQIPFVQLSYGNGVGDWLVRLPAPPALRARGIDRCTARVFVDGAESNWALAQDLAPDQVAAVEVFRRAHRIPAQYGGTSTLGNGVCGAVFFWTKSAS